MPPLAGHPVGAFDQLPVHHDAAAAAGADDDAEHAAITHACAVGRLTEREAIGVVAHAHLALQPGGDVLVEEMPVQRD